MSSITPFDVLPDESGKRTERLNVRLTPEAHATIREAAATQGQDLTSFVLGAALDRARAILVEDRLMRLTPHEVQQIENALDREPKVSAVLAARLRRVRLQAGEASQHDRRIDA